MLFGQVFGQPELAAALVRSALDPVTAGRIDWTSLVRADLSFVDADHGHLYSDLVFTASIDGRQGYLYLLLERANDGRPVHLLVQRNVVRLLEQWSATHADAAPPPPVVPYVMRLDQRP